MSIDVTVVRVFTDRQGGLGNPLGIVSASEVGEPDRQALAAELGFSETVFVTPGANGRAAAAIYTPAVQLPFAGHPTVGVSWWLRERGTTIDTLSVPAGDVSIRYDEDLTWVRAAASWTPDFVFHEVASPREVQAADPSVFAGGNHYVWAWADETAGTIRSRMFAPEMGIVEDEATGAAAVRITDALGRDLVIEQGRGSTLVTTLNGQWIELGGRTVADRTFSV
ncbi:MAG: PhzF family phenazine biosynthesis protein [Rhodococcus sp. (in: high G+C Gram-positive bacteria)]